MTGRGNTPGRTTRSRAQTPLPALQVRQSHAYGAAGKASLQAQVTTSQNAVDEAFTATARPSREPSALPPRRSTRGRKTQSAVEEAPVEPEPEPEVDEVDATDPNETGGEDRPSTSLQTSAIYAQHNQPAASPAAPPAAQPAPPRRSPLRPPPPQQPQAPQAQQQAQVPPPQQPLLPVIPESLIGRMILIHRVTFNFVIPFLGMSFVWLMMLIGILTVATGTFFFAPLPGDWTETRANVTRGMRIAAGIPGYDQPPGAIELAWYFYKHEQLWNDVFHHLTDNITTDLQYHVNSAIIVRLNETYNTVQEHSDAIADIRRMLPYGLALVEQDGEWVIPSLFWNAFLDKVTSEDASPLWDKFFALNKQHISDLQDDILQGKIDDMTRNQRLLIHNQLQAALEDNRRLMEKTLDEKVLAMKHQISQETRLEITEITKNLFVRGGEGLARLNILYHMEKRLHERNYLSPAFGALVDPKITSRNARDLSTAQYFWQLGWWMTGLVGSAMPEMASNPPVNALLSWEETGQCWCSAHHGDTKAQLGVKLGAKVHPEALILEHIPAQGTQDIAAAPHVWELWAQAENETEAARLRISMEAKNSMVSDEPCGAPPSDAPERWVCMLRAKYDIHNDDYIKSYPLDYHRTEDEDDILFTDRVVFKVLDNWGNDDHTCIYRVRLTGLPRHDFMPTMPKER